MSRPGEEEGLRKKARGEFDARVGVVQRSKVVVKKFEVKKFWVNGRATEDREEWCEEVRLHCENSYDDKSETPVVQDE